MDPFRTQGCLEEIISLNDINELSAIRIVDERTCVCHECSIDKYSLLKKGSIIHEEVVEERKPDKESTMKKVTDLRIGRRSSTLKIGILLYPSIIFTFFS